MISAARRWQSIDIERVRPDSRTPATDQAAVEAPLEIRLDGQSFVVTMRTPGDDHALACGFLLSERVVTSPDEIAGVTSPEPDVIDVALRGPAAAALADRLARRRQVTATSACGVCGRPATDALAFDAAPIVADWTMAPAVVSSLPPALREHQAAFDATGGLHAAGVFDRSGALVAAAEDVGRHNAVDKVIGRLLRDGRLPLSDNALCVSGRASFELVQKAVVAGIPMLVAVSAPSSLAVDLARERNVTLVGFTRGDGFNVYTHPRRIA